MAERGQLYTLEGITAGIVVLLGLLFALQATVATPSATGSLGPHAEQQDRATVQNALNLLDDETIRATLLYWDRNAGDDGAFHCTPGGMEHYPGSTRECTSPSPPVSGSVPPTEFGKVLEQRLGDAYSYNVLVKYHQSGGGLATQRLIFQGQPGTGAVRASTSVVVMDDAMLRTQDGDPAAESVAAAADDDEFYAKDTDDDDEFFNLLHVEVIAWRA